MQQKRHQDRLRTLIKGQVILNGGSSTFDCAVRNWSDDGALLALPGASKLPDSFFLSVPHKGVNSAVDVAWKLDDQIGVKFVVKDEPMAKRVAHLEAENVKLRAQIAEMQRRAQEDGVAYIFGGKN